MKLKNILKTTTLIGCFTASSLAFANVTLLENADFSDTVNDPWITVTNAFKPVGAYIATLEEDLNDYAWNDVLSVNGSEIVFTRYDDGQNDHFETFLYQEWDANEGGVDPRFPNETFEVGDKIVFKGTASAVRTGPDTSDTLARAMIKYLGNTPWDYAEQAGYSVYQVLTETPTPFELTSIFTGDEQTIRVQIGFMSDTKYDESADAVDNVVITFSNLEAYIEREPVLWAGYTVDGDGYVDTTDWMGMLYVTDAPWVYSVDLAGWLYLDETQDSTTGAWVYKPAPPSASVE